MEKSNNSSGDGEDYSCELPNFELKFFAWPPPKKYANLSEQELIQTSWLFFGPSPSAECLNLFNQPIQLLFA